MEAGGCKGAGGSCCDSRATRRPARVGGGAPSCAAMLPLLRWGFMACRGKAWCRWFAQGPGCHRAQHEAQEPFVLCPRGHVQS